MTMKLTSDLARAAAQDAGNKSMRKNGRKQWSQDDYRVACNELERLHGYLIVGGRDDLDSK